jgi:hypothetical protein
MRFQIAHHLLPPLIEMISLVHEAREITTAKNARNYSEESALADPRT